jgi:hypothetical protein
MEVLIMKLFIFESMLQVSDNYHSGGGLVVIAKDEEHVKELIKFDENITIYDNDWKFVKVYDLKNNEEPKIFVFPDAGCC